MLTPRLISSQMMFACLVFFSGMVYCQSYPSKIIRIVTIEPGGGTDFAARLIAQAISGPLGQPIIVENRGGASGILAVQTVAKAAPDGHTVLFNSGSTWLLPFLQENLPYDPVKDLSPITMAVRQPSVLTVHPSLPVRSVKELIALAKARPGQLACATGSIGSSTHLSPELFQAMAGIRMLHISYRGGTAALNSLLSGEVQVMFSAPGSARPHIKSGRLRALAVTTAESSEIFPGVPTIAASGLPGYESVASFGVFAPAKTPEAIIIRLNQEIIRALATTDVKTKLLAAGMEPVGSSPGTFAAAIQTDMAKWGKIIKASGISAK